MTKEEIGKFAREHNGLSDATTTLLSEEDKPKLWSQSISELTIDEIAEIVNWEMAIVCEEHKDTAYGIGLTITATDGAHMSETWREIPWLCQFI